MEVEIQLFPAEEKIMWIPQKGKSKAYNQGHP